MRENKITVSIQTLRNRIKGIRLSVELESKSVKAKIKKKESIIEIFHNSFLLTFLFKEANKIPKDNEMKVRTLKIDRSAGIEIKLSKEITDSTAAININNTGREIVWLTFMGSRANSRQECCEISNTVFSNVYNYKNQKMI